MASPAANCFDAFVFELAEVDDAPLGRGMKPRGSRYLPKRPSVSGEKLDIDSGTAIGRAPAMEDAGVAPVMLDIIDSNVSLVLCSMIAFRNSPPVMRGVAATKEPDGLPSTCAILSISSIGGMPAIASLPNGNEYASPPMTLPSIKV